MPLFFLGFDCAATTLTNPLTPPTGVKLLALLSRFLTLTLHPHHRPTTAQHRVKLRVSRIFILNPKRESYIHSTLVMNISLFRAIIIIICTYIILEESFSLQSRVLYYIQFADDVDVAKRS